MSSVPKEVIHPTETPAVAELPPPFLVGIEGLQLKGPMLLEASLLLSSSPLPTLTKLPQLKSSAGPPAHRQLRNLGYLTGPTGGKPVPLHT